MGNPPRLTPEEEREVSLRHDDDAQLTPREKLAGLQKDIALLKAAWRAEVTEAIQAFAQSGNPLSALYVIDLCFEHDIEVPGWAKAAFGRAISEVAYGKATWDSVFGRPPTSGKVWRFHRDLELVPLMRAVRDANRPIDDSLLADIGKGLHIPIGPGTAKKLYGRFLREYGKTPRRKKRVGNCTEISKKISVTHLHRTSR
jgi:hypothetical protein